MQADRHPANTESAFDITAAIGRCYLSGMLGKFSKRVLLTGAGWSRNWGGQLATEVWSSLMGHRLVPQNARLRDLLLEETAFELALGRANAAPFTEGDRADLEHAVVDTFIAMDRAIAQPDRDPWINIYKVQEFLFRFWGAPSDGNEAGYLFTLNQDLFFERYLYNGHTVRAPGGALPGLVGMPGQNWFSSLTGSYGPDFIMRPIAEPARKGVLKNQMNVIKLHGSFNWRSEDGQNLLVVGTEKTAKIAAMPLLAWYNDLFKQTLSAGGVRMMIAGYGFADEHINAVIAEAIEKHGLSVFVWNTSSDLKGLIQGAPHGLVIWKGLISTAMRPLIEVFPGNQAETEEYRRIRDTFFA